MKSNLKFASNFLTSLNLFSGFMAIIFAFEGKINIAFYFMVLGLIFDMADGRIARALGISSKFGIEFDSLADLITFGVAPSSILYNAFFNGFEFGKIFCFLPTLAVAIRLARFNISTESKPKEYFEGLSAPMGAFVLISIVMITEKTNPIFRDIVIPVSVIAISLLQVSTIKFRSFKDVKMSKLMPYLLFIPPIFLWLLFFKQKIFFIILLCLSFAYIFYNIIFENILKHGKGIYIRHNAERRRASTGVFNDHRGKGQNGIGS